MKFNFAVKHNGILYPAGKEVPIGKETRKENQINDKSATDIKKELKEVYGVTKFDGNSKEKLAAQLLEEEAKAKEKEETKEESNDDAEEVIPTIPTVTEGEESTEETGEESFLDTIINE